MGRPKNPLTQIHIRISEENLQKIDDIAAKSMLNRTDTIRILLDYALANKTGNVAPHELLK